MSIINWTQYRPATRVNNFRGTYLELPAFSLDTGIVWKGASEVVMQFNYSAAKDFVLLARPTKPTGVNFGLCIRYRVGDSVTRYKLWEDDAFILSGVAAPLYNGERIRANFVLEIWSFEELTKVSLATAIQMTTSVRNNITSLSARSVESFATGAEFTELQNINTTPVPPPTNLRYQWETDFGVTLSAGLVLTWTDKIAAKNLSPSGGFNPFYTNVAAINGQSAVSFENSAYSLQANTATGNLKCFSAVIRQTGYTSARNIFEWRNFLNTRLTSLEQYNASPELTFDRGGVAELTNNGATFDTWKAIVVYLDLVDGDYIWKFDVYDLNANLLSREEVNLGTVEPSLLNYTAIHLGNSTAAGALFMIASLLDYSEYSTGLSQSIANYYSYKYGGNAIITLPLTFNTGSSWLSNEEL